MAAFYWRRLLRIGPAYFVFAGIALVLNLGTISVGPPYFQTVFVPIAMGLHLSMQAYSYGIPGGSVGLRNYVDVLRDPDTLTAAVHTAGYMVVAVAIELTLALGFALALNRPFRGRGFVLAALVLPWALPSVVSSLLFNFTTNGNSQLLTEGFKGVLCKGGTIKSHLGVLSREFRIPCLMAVEVTEAAGDAEPAAAHHAMVACKMRDPAVPRG